MTTARLTLFDRSFLGDFGALVEDAEVLRFTRFPAAPPPDFAERWLERYEAGRAAGTMDAFAILDGEDRFAGLAVAPRIDETARTAELTSEGSSEVMLAPVIAGSPIIY